jgi:hypothetical protein
MRMVVGPPSPRACNPAFFSYLERKGEDADERQLAILFLALVAGASSGLFPGVRRGPAEFIALQMVNLNECGNS